MSAEKIAQAATELLAEGYSFSYDPDKKVYIARKTDPPVYLRAESIPDLLRLHYQGKIDALTKQLDDALKHVDALTQWRASFIQGLDKFNEEEKVE